MKKLEVTGTSPFIMNDAKPEMKVSNVGTDLVDRVSGFLDKIRDANDKLCKDIEDQGKDQFDIENVDGSHQYVEMDLQFLVDVLGDDEDDPDSELSITQKLERYFANKRASASGAPKSNLIEEVEE
jgi:hypothetical protein